MIVLALQPKNISVNKVMARLSSRKQSVASMALAALQLLLGLGFGLFATAQEKPSAKNEQVAREREEREEKDTARKRIEWFYQQRAFPLGFIPAGARQKALEQLDRMLREVSERQAGLAEGNVAPPPPSTATWTAIGPQPISTPFSAPFVSGRVTALAVDQTDATGNIVYAGGAQGGVWMTTDGGAHWSPLTDSQPSLATGSIAIAPSNHSIIYVGTGEQNGFGFDVYYGAGVLKSTDGGNTWVQKGAANFVGPFGTAFFPGGGARIGSLAVHPSNANIVLAGVQIFSGTDTGPGVPGIYCSSDGGDTWTNILPGAVGTEVIFATPTTLYAALGRPTGPPSPGDPDNGVYKSTTFDAAAANPCATANFTRVTNTGGVLPTGTATGRIEMAVAPSNPSIVYAAIADPASASSTLLGMFMTTNGGTTWTKLANTPDFCAMQCWFDLVVRVHPTNPNLVFAGGSAGSLNRATLFRSTDGGTSWTNITTGANSIRLHVDHHALAFSAAGTKLYVGNDGGVWSTTDVTPASSGALPNWNNLNGPNGPGGLALAQFYPGHSIHPSNDQVSFGGTQDNGTVKYSGDFAWNDLQVCGDGGWTAIDPASPSTVYAACQDIDINRSLQNGDAGTFAATVNGIDQADRNNFIAPLVIDPNPANSLRLYFGTFRVWQTTDGGGSWTAISPDLTGGNPASLTTIAVAPPNSSVVYVGTDGGKVQVSANVAPGSAAWNDRSTGLPNRSVTQVVVDPGDPTGNTAYATFSGFTFGADTQGHIFRTVNGTTFTGPAVWTDISGNLPNTPVNDLVIDPDIANTLYVGTDVGVFFSSNGGTNWAPLVIGLPRVAVFSLKLNRASRILRAATHGRGVWDLQLGNVPAFNLRSISPTSANAGDPAPPALSLNGSGFTNNSRVVFNGTPRVPSSVSPTQLTLALNAADVANGGAIPVAVSDPGPPAATTKTLLFTILSSPPTLNSISPTSATVGGGAFTLTGTGSGFSPNSQLVFNGTKHNGTVPSGGTTLSATIAASEIANAGTVQVSVFTAGGGLSSETPFNIVAGDFALSSPTGAQTVNAGLSASYTITVTPQNGFNTAVTFSASSCSFSPVAIGTLCSFNPTSVTPGTTPGNSTMLTISTTARSLLPPAPSIRQWPRRLPTPWLVVITSALAVAMLAALQAKRRKLAAYLPLAALLVLLALHAVGCGGGGGGTPPPNGTPAGTYTVTVTGTSGTTTHNTTVTLKVN